MAATTTSVSIKLLIDTRNNKVLFAEAGKEFVDFLFNLLALPVGTVICLLKKDNMVGCLGNLYESVERLSSTYMQPDVDKNSILKPKNTLSGTTSLPLLLAYDQAPAGKLYMCSYANHNGFEASTSCIGYVSSDPTVLCPKCKRNYLTREVSLVGTKAVNVGTGSTGGSGYVRGLVSYMVMDDLVVQPMSTISSITMLNKFNIKEVGTLAEKVVELNMTQGLKLLKESLSSQTVLSNVFLRKSA